MILYQEGGLKIGDCNKNSTYYIMVYLNFEPSARTEGLQKRKNRKSKHQTTFATNLPYLDME